MLQEIVQYLLRKCVAMQAPCSVYKPETSVVSEWITVSICLIVGLLLFRVWWLRKRVNITIDLQEMCSENSELLSVGGGSWLMAQFSVISMWCCWLPAFAIPYFGVKELRIHVFRHQCWSSSLPASHNDPDLIHPKATLARQRDSSLYRQARNCLANYEARLKWSKFTNHSEPSPLVRYPRSRLPNFSF